MVTSQRIHTEYGSQVLFIIFQFRSLIIFFQYQIDYNLKGGSYGC